MLILDQQIEEYVSINIDTRYANWSAGATYNFGDIAFDDHYYYKSIIDSNIGLRPSTNSEQWLRWDVSNRYAQIDMQARTVTTCDSSSKTGGLPPFTLISEFQNDRYDAIALGTIFASSILIEIVSESSVVAWSTIVDMTRRRPDVVDWYTYYFLPLPDEETINSENFFFRLPIYSSSYTIRVTLEEKSGSSSCAYMICGNSVYIGDTLFGVNLGIVDYSNKEIDKFGILDLTRRESRQTMDVDIVYDAGNINIVNREIREHLGRVCLFVNDESEDSKYENLLLLGMIDDFTTILSSPTKIQASIQLGEVI